MIKKEKQGKCFMLPCSKFLKAILMSTLSMLISCQIEAQIYGCTDPLANNYTVSAEFNDGSCVYPVTSVSPTFTFPLDSTLNETSGLIYFNGQLVTHNDNDDIHLYLLDTLDGHIIGKDSLKACMNKEWEEISQDSFYVYLGDFGNNTSGNRTDLHILRVEKSSLTLATPIVDTIYFSYADQVDFSSHAANTTDFDCESFVVSKDSIYLFTKQWQSKQTVVYVLPKVPGNYSARPIDTFNVNGLVTGATYLEEERLLVLCGYSNLLLPFSYLCYDFEKQDFFGANKRRLTINSLAIHQIEGIATNNGLKYFMSNESFIQGSLINSPQQFHVFDFSAFLGDYLSHATSGFESIQSEKELSIYPNPVENDAWIKSFFYCPDKITYHILDPSGKRIFTGFLDNSQSPIDTRKLANGMYIIELSNPYNKRISIMKLLR